MSGIEIITTGDGSHSLLNTELNETYHSQHGAIQESMHVFIERGFHEVVGLGEESVNIFEVGFGTGLNAWLTLKANSAAQCSIRYTSIDSMPLEENVWSKLNYVADGEKDEFAKLHLAQWNTSVMITKNFCLEKRQITLQEAVLESESYQLIYFDAFAPSKQPELWTADLLHKVAKALTPRGVFVTYCAKGQVKRDLKAIGLTVETLDGPPGKKEMVRARRL